MKLDFFKKLFGSKEYPAQTLETQNDHEFVKYFIESIWYFLTIPIPAGEDIQKLTREELMKLIKDGAEAVSKATEVIPLYEHREGKVILPLFTDQKKPETYVGEYCKRMGKVIPFGIFGIQGRAILQAIEGADEVVLNPMCPDKKILSKEIIGLLMNAKK